MVLLLLRHMNKTSCGILYCGSVAWWSKVFCHSLVEMHMNITSLGLIWVVLCNSRLLPLAIHASMSWIQLLMWDRQWLKSNVSSHVLRQGSFIPCNYPRAVICDPSGLHCTVCLIVKARVHTPGVSRPKSWPPVQFSKLIERIDGVCRKEILKSKHTQHGDCVSADHYIPAGPGWLPNIYGWDQQG